MCFRVGLEARFAFGFRKLSFLQKCWLPGRLWLPSIQKLLALASALASLNAVFDGFSFGFGFVIFFMAGFSFLEFCIWLPRFNRRFDKTFIHKPRLDFYLSVGTLFASIRSSRHLCLSCASRKTGHFQCGWKGCPSRKKYPLSQVFETMIVICCNGGDV